MRHLLPCPPPERTSCLSQPQMSSSSYTGMGLASITAPLRAQLGTQDLGCAAGIRHGLCSSLSALRCPCSGHRAQAHPAQALFLKSALWARECCRQHHGMVWVVGRDLEDHPVPPSVATFLFTWKSKAQFLPRIFLHFTVSEPQRRNKTVLILFAAPVLYQKKV